MRSIRTPAIHIITLIIVVIGLVQAQQPTSFNFEGIRYTFYPGEVARTWSEANGFCKSLGKELAVFATRSQIRNVSEYLSPEGGVWTGYKTNADCKFESAELADFEWKKEFGTPSTSKAKPKQCGLLSVANYTGIIATDCSTRKAALCSLSNPDAVEAETIRDSGALPPKPSPKTSNSTAPRAPAPVPKSAGVTTPVKPAKPAEKESDDADAKPKEAKPKEGKPSPAKPAAKPAEKKPSTDEIRPDPDTNKISGEDKKPAADKKGLPDNSKPAAEANKPSEEVKKPASYKPAAADDKKPDADAKKPAGDKKPDADAKKPAGDNKPDGDAKKPTADKKPDGDVKKPTADAKKAAAEPKAKGEEKYSAAKPKPSEAKAGAKGKKPVADDTAATEGETEEEETPPPTTKPPTNQLPVSIESEGGRFTFFPNHIMFGGYMEYSRFCEDKGLQPAVFTTRSQLEDVASHVNSVVMVWTGYSTDSQGNVHSVDEANAAWQPEFNSLPDAASPSLMCGALSTAANKVGVTMNSCASAHEALCSAKVFSKKHK